jgi:DNA-binding beta-propeller fold protein YncE
MRAAVVLLLALAAAVFCSTAGSAASGGLLMLERTIRLDGVAGRIDHLAIDPGRQRLLVAELGNDSVDLIDLASGKAVRRIARLQEPQGVAYLPGPDLIAVASAGDGSVRLFKGADASPAGVVELGDDADNIRVDPLTGHAIVGYGAGGLAVIDAAAGRKIADIRLPAHPEGFQLRPRDRRIFVNIPDAREIAVIDLDGARQVATWRVPEADANFPMAVDDAGDLLAVAFRRPARLVLLDANSGSTKAVLPTCGDADDLFFNPMRRRIYVSCGAGSADIFQDGVDGYRHVAAIDTAPGARTALFVPSLDRLFVAARANASGSPAAILVFRPAP